MNYYEVILLDATKTYDNKYTYKSELNIDIGSRVYVPFGSANISKEGVVVSSINEPDSDYVIKEVKEVLNGKMTLNNLLLVDRLCDYYVQNPASVLRLYFQEFKRKDVKRRLKTYYDFSIGKEELLEYTSSLRANSKQIPEFIFSHIDSRAPFQKPSSITSKNFNKLISDGIIVEHDFREDVVRLNKLTDKQHSIFSDILRSNERVHMLIGANASGKTEIFFHLIENVEGIKLVLVPELFQIPQLEKRAREFFGSRVGVIHSKLSNSKRIEVEKKALEGKIDILIGTPIALFLNVDYSFIVLDEFHDDSYRIMSPSIDVRYGAIMLSDITGAKVLLSSATPALEYYFDPIIQKHILSNKYISDIKSEIELVDMRDELLSGNRSYISKALDKSIRDTLGRNKQVLILMNKKGKHSYVSCRECGFVYKCESCDLPYLHMGKSELECRLCSRKLKIGANCPKCKSEYIKYYGGGIIKLEEEVNKLYPKARVLRLESSSFRNESSLNDIYESINSGKYDIIIGTHIIAKALDIKNVELSAAVMADSIMNISEYRAYERAYQILSQLAGRASRFSSGKTIIQTYNPDIYVFKHLLNDDYIGFSDEELSVRMDTNYPPFINHVLFKAYLEDENAEILESVINDVRNLGVNASDIYQPIYSRINDKNVYHILFSSVENIDIIKEYFLKFMKENKKFSYRIEVDPLYLMY